MFRKILASTVLTGLAIGAVAVPAAHATTATNDLVTINVPSTVVYKTGACATYPYSVALNVNEGEHWMVVGLTENAAMKDADVTEGVGPRPVSATMRLCPRRDGVGPMQYAVGALRESDPEAAPEVVVAQTTLKTPSASTAVVTPKHVKKGKTIKARGKVTYRTTSWQKRAVRKQRVTLQFQPVGSTTWTNVKTVKTRTNGRYTFTTKARQDGKFRVVYGGTATVGNAISPATFIDVR